MLVLSRGTAERVKITTADGQVVWLTLLYAHKNRARLGFVADSQVRIDREEVAERRAAS